MKDFQAPKSGYAIYGLWGVALFLLGVAAFGAWNWLAPREPYIPSYKAAQPPHYAEYPGGSGCEHDRFRSLSTAAEREAERDKCAEAQAVQRHDQDDLIQQTRAANAAEQTSILTYYQAELGFWQTFTTVVTGILLFWTLWETRRTARAAMDANKLAYGEYVATHRPRLILRDAFSTPVAPDAPIVVQYKIANVGGTEATILNSFVLIEVRAQHQPRSLPLVPRSQGHNMLYTPKPLAGGETYDFVFPADVPWPSFQTSPTLKAIDQGAEVHFCGHLAYIDNAGVKREMAFRRVFNHTTSRFQPSKGESDQLDYAD